MAVPEGCYLQYDLSGWSNRQCYLQTRSAGILKPPWPGLQLKLAPPLGHDFFLPLLMFTLAALGPALDAVLNTDIPNLGAWIIIPAHMQVPRDRLWPVSDILSILYDCFLIWITTLIKKVELFDCATANYLLFVNCLSPPRYKSLHWYLSERNSCPGPWS